MDKYFDTAFVGILVIGIFMGLGGIAESMLKQAIKKEVTRQLSNVAK